MNLEGYLYVPDTNEPPPFPSIIVTRFGCRDETGKEIGYAEGMKRLTPKQREQVEAALWGIKPSRANEKI